MINLKLKNLIISIYNVEKWNTYKNDKIQVLTINNYKDLSKVYKLLKMKYFKKYSVKILKNRILLKKIK
tara:strand:- start:1224 stop:1430 length:207 start_codon:yes stop_codon:yes gene_type:complete